MYVFQLVEKINYRGKARSIFRHKYDAKLFEYRQKRIDKRDIRNTKYVIEKSRKRKKEIISHRDTKNI